MTENYPAAVIDQAPAVEDGLAQPRADASATDIAKDQAASVGHNAGVAGQQVASTAKDEALNVASVAGNQAKDLVGQARSELTEQASAQQQRVVSGLHSVGDELNAMTDHDGEPGVATDLARQAAAKSHEVASWLENRQPGQLVEEVKDFARQRPVAFLALAVGAGLLAGRLTRGVKDTGSEEPTAAAQPVVPSGSSTPASAVTSAGFVTPADIVSGQGV
jgi:hypothetical protein